MSLFEIASVHPFFQLVPLVVFLPVLGLLINLLVGKYLGEKGVGAVASLATGGAFAVAVLLAVGSDPGHRRRHVNAGQLDDGWQF